MNKQNCEKFTEIILKVTNKTNINDAIYILAKRGYIDRECLPKLYNPKLADAILYSLRNIDFDKKVYNRDTVSKYLNQHFKGHWNLRCFLKPLVDEIQDMVNDSVNKLEEITVSKFTEKELKEKIFTRRVIFNHNVEEYGYYIRNLNLDFKSDFSYEAYKIVINKYNYKFDTLLGSSNQRTNKKIELLNEKFDYKLKEIILSLQSKYSKEYIVDYLDITNNLYKNICKKMNIETSSYKNKSIKLNINTNQDEINKVEEYNIKFCDEISVKEGKRKLCIHYKIERDYKIIKLAKIYFKNKYGKLFCECCGLNFEDKYGELGKDYIEAHHENPLSENEGEVETKIKDFRMVCANCHSMLHRRVPCLKILELKDIVIVKD